MSLSDGTQIRFNRQITNRVTIRVDKNLYPRALNASPVSMYTTVLPTVVSIDLISFWLFRFEPHLSVILIVIMRN